MAIIITITNENYINLEEVRKVVHRGSIARVSSSNFVAKYP